MPVLGVVVAAWTVFWAAYVPYRWGWLTSWHFFVAGPRRLVGLGFPGYGAPGGLNLYASYPKLQSGPLTFLVALPLALLPWRASEAIGCAVMVAAGPVIILLLADAAARLRGLSRSTAFRSAGLVWLLLTPPWMLLAIFWGHFDDVLALLLVAAGINAIARRRPMVAAVLIGGSAAAKPWALAFIPLAVAMTDSRRIRYLGTALAVALVPWLPFVLADPHTLRAASFKIRIIPVSVLSLFHVAGSTPSWVRPCQFLGGALLVAAGVRSGRWAAGVLLAVALRLGIDPNVYSYYTTGLLVGAGIWDLLGSRFRLPVVTATCFITVYCSSFLALPRHDHAELRLLTVVTVPLLVYLTSERVPVPRLRRPTPST